jgi:hypothetical protein
MSKEYVGFEVLTAIGTKMAVFWVVAPCSLVDIYQRFRGPCCLHHQGDDNPEDSHLSMEYVPTVKLISSSSGFFYMD